MLKTLTQIISFGSSVLYKNTLKQLSRFTVPRKYYLRFILVKWKFFYIKNTIKQKCKKHNFRMQKVALYGRGRQAKWAFDEVFFVKQIFL